jgi:hypothetical protein
MRKTIRATVFAVALLGTFAFASSALAATFSSPKLMIKNGPTGVTITVTVSNSDDPTSRVAIYVPPGYTINPPTLGSKLGDVVASASAADLGGAVLPLTGELDAISESALSPAAKASEASCIQGGTPAAIWDMHLAAAGQTLDIPMYVVPTTGVEQTAGIAKIVTCLPPPDVPASNPARSTFGAKLLSATFTTSALTAPAGATRWTSLWTPYTPGAGTPNAAGSVETQAVIKGTAAAHIKVTKKRLVSYKKVHGKKVKVVKTKVTYSAGGTQGGAAVSGVISAVTKNGSPVSPSGSFVLAAGKAATLVATEKIPDQDLAAAGCTPTPLFQGVPCIDATVAGDTATTTVKVIAYKK